MHRSFGYQFGDQPLTESLAACDTELEKNKILRNERDTCIIQSIMIIIVLSGAVWLSFFISAGNEINSGQGIPVNILSIQFMLNIFILLIGIFLLCASNVTVGSCNTNFQLRLFKWWCNGALCFGILTCIGLLIVFINFFMNINSTQKLWSVILHCVCDGIWTRPIHNINRLFKWFLQPNWTGPTTGLNETNNLNNIMNSNSPSEAISTSPAIIEED